MSRIANNPINIPTGVDVNIAGNMVTIKGSKGELSHNIHPLISPEDNITFLTALLFRP